MTEDQATNALRNRAAQYLSYEVAISSGMTGLSDLEQWVAGNYHPTSQQLLMFANRTGGWPK